MKISSISQPVLQNFGAGKNSAYWKHKMPAEAPLQSGEKLFDALDISASRNLSLFTQPFLFENIRAMQAQAQSVKAEGERLAEKLAEHISKNYMCSLKIDKHGSVSGKLKPENLDLLTRSSSLDTGGLNNFRVEYRNSSYSGRTADVFYDDGTNMQFDQEGRLIKLYAECGDDLYTYTRRFIEYGRGRTIESGVLKIIPHYFEGGKVSKKGGSGIYEFYGGGSSKYTDYGENPANYRFNDRYQKTGSLLEMETDSARISCMHNGRMLYEDDRRKVIIDKNGSIIKQSIQGSVF